MCKAVLQCTRRSNFCRGFEKCLDPRKALIENVQTKQISDQTRDGTLCRFLYEQNF